MPHRSGYKQVILLWFVYRKLYSHTIALNRSVNSINIYAYKGVYEIQLGHAGTTSHYASIVTKNWVWSDLSLEFLSIMNEYEVINNVTDSTFVNIICVKISIWIAVRGMFTYALQKKSAAKTATDWKKWINKVLFFGIVSPIKITWNVSCNDFYFMFFIFSEVNLFP